MLQMLFSGGRLFFRGLLKISATVIPVLQEISRPGFSESESSAEWFCPGQEDCRRVCPA